MVCQVCSPCERLLTGRAGPLYGDVSLLHVSSQTRLLHWLTRTFMPETCTQPRIERDAVPNL